MSTLDERLVPLSLYIHLPWCVRKCPYCDFNSHAVRGQAPKERYIEALIADLRSEAARSAGRPLGSVFFGGGTPSLFSPAEIARVMDGVRAEFELAGDVEVTLEANPGTVECADVGGYLGAGVNRLSLGAQSFAPAMLEALGRIHTVDDTERSYRVARDAGFENINLDLMYALPGQTVDGAVADLRRAVDLRPDHVSWYQLTLEPNTVFFARPPANLPDDDAAWEMQLQGQAVLDSAGFGRYETSAWARGGRRCRHNMNYWTYGDYLAVGAGAHGKYTNAGSIWRYAKPANPLAYIESLERGDMPAPPTAVEAGERLFEYMLNVLRLTDAFTEASFAERTGLPAGRFREKLAEAQAKGLVEADEEAGWRVSGLGQRFLNDLQAAFLP